MVIEIVSGEPIELDPQFLIARDSKQSILAGQGLFILAKCPDCDNDNPLYFKVVTKSGKQQCSKCGWFSDLYD